MLPQSASNFCQLLSDTSSSVATVGEWFNRVYINGLCWEGESEVQEMVSRAEDYLVSQLLESHELPTTRAITCQFSTVELSRIVPLEDQWEIWKDLTGKFPIPQKLLDS